MISAILSLIPVEWLLGALGVFVVGMGAYFKGRTAGKLANARKDLEAAKDRLEMNREATDIEKRVAGMTDDEARREAMKWAKR